MNGRLYRSRDERVIAGVAGGLADYLDIDPALVRVLWVILALFSGGAFLIVYIVMALVVPEEPWPATWVGGAPPVVPGAAPAPDAAADAGATTPDGATTTAATSAAAAPGAPTTSAPMDWHSQREQWRAERAAWREQRRADRAARRAAGGDATGAGVVFGLILVAIGLFFLVPILLPTFDVGRYWPLILVGLGVLLVVGAMRPRRP